MNITEIEIVNAIRDSIKKPKIYVLENEYQLLSAHNIFSSLLPPEDQPPKKVVGKIDLLFKYKSSIYGCEIKNNLPTKQDAFWHSLKILGYCTYYKFQTGKTIKPAVMIPFDNITLESQYVCSSLKVKLFGYYKKDGEIKIQEISEKPIWHQSKQ
jgi:hypothetical protein